MEVRPLGEDELARVDAVLPLHRLDQEGVEYLVVWDGEAPVGHACMVWTEPAEITDVWVLPERRGNGVGSALLAGAESIAAGRGHRRVFLYVGERNAGAIRLYERLGYRRTRDPPLRRRGTVVLRGRAYEVDDTLLRYDKRL